MTNDNLTTIRVYLVARYDNYALYGWEEEKKTIISYYEDYDLTRELRDNKMQYEIINDVITVLDWAGEIVAQYKEFERVKVDNRGNKIAKWNYKTSKYEHLDDEIRSIIDTYNLCIDYNDGFYTIDVEELTEDEIETIINNHELQHHTYLIKSAPSLVLFDNPEWVAHKKAIAEQSEVTQ